YAWRQRPDGMTRSAARCGRAAFDALKLDALQNGFLRDHSTVTLVGVGVSHERWRTRLAGTRRVVRAIHAGRASSAALAQFEAPAVLVFGSPVARARWRAALGDAGWREEIDFIFVA